MSTQATETEAIKRSVTVDCSVEHAFATFTERIHEWWPLAKHSIDAGETGSPPRTVIFQGEAGGQLFERTKNGEDLKWADVIAYEPPHRLVDDPSAHFYDGRDPYWKGTEARTAEQLPPPEGPMYNSAEVGERVEDAGGVLRRIPAVFGRPSVTLRGGEPVSPASIECFASGHHSWIRSVNVANACSTEQSTVTERLIASVSVACVLMPSSSRLRPSP